MPDPPGDAGHRHRAVTRRWAAVFVGLMAPALAGAISASGESTPAWAAPVAADPAVGRAGGGADAIARTGCAGARPLGAHRLGSRRLSRCVSRLGVCFISAPGGHDHPGGHEGDEGLVLRPATEESVAGAAACTSDAAVRAVRHRCPCRRHHPQPLRRPRPRGAHVHAGVRGRFGARGRAARRRGSLARVAG